MNNNFEIYDAFGNLVTQITVFDDGSYWIGTDGEHNVAINELNEDDEDDIIDDMLDYLDKHNRTRNKSALNDMSGGYFYCQKST